MAQLLSDDEVFGKQQQSQQLLSDDDVFGTQKSGDKQDRTWGEFGKDVGLSAVQGLDTLAKLPAMAYDKATTGDWYGPETQKISAMSDEREKLKSEHAQAKNKDKAAKAQEAGNAAREYVGDGALGTAAQVAAEFGSSFWESMKDPSSIPEFAANQLAQLGAMGKVGKGAEIAANAAAKAAPRIAATKAGQAALSKAGTAGAVGFGAGLQGVDVGSDTMQRLMALPDDLWAQNPDYVTLASEIGSKAAKQKIASQLSGDATLKAAAVSLATAAMPGGSSIERALVGKSLGGYKAVPKAFVGEAAQEGAEEGSGKYFGNTSVQDVNPDQDAFEGVGTAAGQGAYMGGVMGGGMHAGKTWMDKRQPTTADLTSDGRIEPNAASATKSTEDAQIDTALAEAKQTPAQPPASPAEPMGEAREVELWAKASDGTLTPEEKAELAAMQQGQPAQPPAADAMPQDATAEQGMPAPEQLPPDVSAPAPIDTRHPTEQAADAVVAALAQEAGIPIETVLPPSTAQQATPLPESGAPQPVDLPPPQPGAEAGALPVDTLAQASEIPSMTPPAVEITAHPRTEKEARALRAQQQEISNAPQAAKAALPAVQEEARQESPLPEQVAAPKTERAAREQRRKTDILTPDGKKVAAQWDVVEADSIKASLKEGVSQPRDRTRAVSNEQVLEIAGNPDFERLSDTSKTMDYGAPTLSADGLIVGGNGRFEGVSRAYDGPAATAYRAAVEQAASRFGLDADAIRGMKKPVLVRRITDNADTRQLAIQSNQAAGLQMSDMEQAALDSERMKSLEQIEVSDTGDIPLTSRNMQAIQQTLAGYSTNELAGMMTADGGLSQSGMRRLRNAILFSAYGKSDTLARLIESPDADMKNVGTALVRAAGKLAKVRTGIAEGGIPAEFDIASDLTAAIETLSGLRAEGKRLDEFLAQGDMFGGGLTQSQRVIIIFLADNLRSAKNITAFLQDYAQQVVSIQDSKGGLFGDMPMPTKQEALDRARKPYQPDDGRTHPAQDLFSATAPELHAGTTGGHREVQTGESGNRPDTRGQSGDEAARESEGRAGTDAGNQNVKPAGQEKSPAGQSGKPIAEDSTQPFVGAALSEPASAVAGEQPAFAGQPEKSSGQTTPNARGQSGSTLADQPADGKIADEIGEHLAGSRKDKAAALRDAVTRELSDDEIASQPLSKIWPKESIDLIEDPFIAAVAHAARAEIPSKPRNKYKVAGWVKTVKTMRGLTASMMSGGLGHNFLENYIKEAGSRQLEHFSAKVSLLESINRANWGRIGRVEEYPQAYRYAEDGKTRVPSPIVHVKIDDKSTRYEAGSVADVMDKVQAALGEAAHPKKMEFEVRGNPGRYSLNKKGDKLYRKLKTFETTKEAFDYRNSNYDDLVAAWGAVKDSDNVKESDVRSKENRQRTAQDWRKGKDVTLEQFQDAFGFRGAAFGNWVSQGAGGKDRQGMLNQAYDALMDLSDIIGVPPKAMSLNGSLGLAFGSRGSGKFAAHFEPDMLVINLTKTRGAGSLAHEWFHALDNYFQSKRGKGYDYITNNPENYYVHKQSGQKLPARAFGKMIDGERDTTYGKIAERYRDRAQWDLQEGVRTEVAEAFADLVKALNESPMAKRASLIDKGNSGGYWSRIIERGARSFENYIIHKMMLKGYSNDYLANVVSIDDFARDEGRYPYLLEGEIAPVAEAFDNLFGTIQTKETDKGVTMFSARQSRADLPPVAQSVVDELIAGLPGVRQAASDARIITVFAPSELSAAILKEAEKQGIPPNEIHGVLHNGFVYIVRQNLKNRQDVEEVLAHEILGHGGAHALMGDARETVLIESFNRAGGIGGVRAIASKHGVLKELDQRLPATSKLSDEQKIAVVDEMLALAQGKNHKLRQAALEWWNRIRNFIISKLDKAGFHDMAAKLDKYDAGEAAVMLRQMREAVIDGGDIGGHGVAFMVARKNGNQPPLNLQDGKAANPQPDLPAETLFRHAQRLGQDKLNRFTVIKDWLAEQGVKLSELADVYKAEERMHSRFANKAEDFREKRVKPLVEKIQKAGFSMDDVAQFLHAQHAQERNAQVAKVNQDRPDAGSGMTDAEAKAILAKVSPELKKLANEFRAIADDTLAILVNSGMVSKEQAAAYRGAYQSYVPLKGGPDDGKPTGTGKGLSARHKIKRALGHEMREGGEWIIENLLADHERALMLREKNIVGIHLLNMAVEVGRADLLTIDKPKKRQVLKENVAYEVLHKGQVIGAFDSQEAARLFRGQAMSLYQSSTPSHFTIRRTSDPAVVLMASPMPADNEVIVYVHGHEIRVQINDEILARAYKNMGTDAMPWIVRVGAGLNAYFSRIYTGYNPEFIVTNIVRDFTTGLANITGEEGIGMAAKSAKNYAARFVELFKYAYTGTETKWVKMYREDGGNTGAAYLSDMERLGKEIQTEYAAYEGVVKNLKAGDYKNAARSAGRKVFDLTLKHIEHLNQAGENAMRLAVYQSMIESGRSRNEAASAAKNSTVNFNRKGELGQQANALWLFFNAGVQGTAAIAHAHAKGKHRKQAWAFSSTLMGLGYLMSLMAAGDDEDKYEKTSEYERSRNLLIKTGDGYAKIPLPYGYGFFWNMGRGMADAQRTGELGKMPWHVASSFVEEFTPFGSTVAGKSLDGLQLATYAFGTIPSIMLAPLTNKSAFGGDFMPNSKFDPHQPDREKMYRATRGTLADDVAGALESAGLDVSPETVKHLARTFTGGAGSFAQSAVDLSILKTSGADVEVKEIPFLRKFYTVPDVRGARSRYYEAKDEATKALSELNRARKALDANKVGKLVDEQYEMIRMAKLAERWSKMTGAARDRTDAIRLTGTYTKAEERAMIRQMEREEEAMYDEYMGYFKEAKREAKQHAVERKAAAR